MMTQKKSKRPALIKYLMAIPVVLLLAILFQSQTVPEVETTQSTKAGITLFEGVETEMTFEETRKYKGVEFMSEDKAIEILGEKARGRNVVNILDTKDYVLNTSWVKTRIYSTDKGWRFSYRSSERGKIKIRTKDKDLKVGEILQFEKRDETLDISIEELISNSPPLQLMAGGSSGNSIETAFIDFNTGVAYDIFSRESSPSLIPIRKEHLKMNIEIAIGFGQQKHPIHKVDRHHKGIDLIADMDTPVYATAEGEVIEAKYNSQYGKYVLIEHNSTYRTIYAHMSSFNVRKGDQISGGEQIGNVGSTGLSTAPHLHYEVRENRIAVDPLPFMKHNIILKSATKNHVKNSIEVIDTIPLDNKSSKISREDGIYIRDNIWPMLDDPQFNLLLVIDGKVSTIEEVKQNMNHLAVVIVGDGITGKEHYGVKGNKGFVGLHDNRSDEPFSIVEKQNDELFKVVEQMPRFPGCENLEGTYLEKEGCAKNKLLKFIGNNLKYPEAAKVKGVQGTNVVQFIIGKDGGLSDMNLIRDIGANTGEATMELMRKMQKEYRWSPGYQRGEAVKVLYTLPIRFKLLELDTTPFNGIKQNTPELLVGLGDIDGEFLNKSSSQKPLIIIDGKGYGYKELDLNPDNIREVTVLKGKEAIDKYGEKATNGVVLVETKDGKYDVREIKVDNAKSIKLDKEMTYKVVEEMPRFPGCEYDDGSQEDKRLCANKKMLEYLYTNLQYPQEARENGIQGMNVVQFVVEENGSMTELSLVREIGGGTREETMRVMENMQKDFTWRPGYQRGVPVRVLYTLPVKFMLSDDESDCCEGEDKNGKEEIDLTSAFGENTTAATAYSLHQNVPNPFGSHTDISFVLPSSGKATITVYNVTGKVVSTIKDQFNKGLNTVRFTKSELGAATGPLYYQLESGEFKKTMKMVVVE